MDTGEQAAREAATRLSVYACVRCGAPVSRQTLTRGTGQCHTCAVASRPKRKSWTERSAHKFGRESASSVDWGDSFWSKVTPEALSGCWLWTGTVNARGYGNFGGNRGGPGGYLAHRVAWLLFHGDPGDLCVLHKCDVPACVNPDHLFLGTRDDNHTDMVAKGRAREASVGGDNPSAKLTERDVLAIRERAALGERLRLIADDYRVHESLISGIKRGVTWKHVGGPVRNARRRIKITSAVLAEMQAARARGESVASIAGRYGVHAGTVHRRLAVARSDA